MSTQQDQQGGGSSNSTLGADMACSSTLAELEAAATALSHLLDCCGTCAPPPYQDLAPALAAALQQGMASSAALATSILHHHASHMALDQPLLGLVLDAADQGQGPAAAVLATLAPQALQALGPTHPGATQLQQRVTALLAGGTAAGSAFLAAALLQDADLWEVPGMVEAACSGLEAACSHAVAADNRRGGRAPKEYACLVELPPPHAVCLQYLRRVVALVLHLATRLGAPLSADLPGPAGVIVPALAQAHCVLLKFLELPWLEGVPGVGDYGGEQRPFHDAAWGTLLALSDCPEAAGLVAGLFQQPRLCEALAGSWKNFVYLPLRECEEPAETAARLAACLLLSGSIPGQEERRQHRELLVAAVRLWGQVWPDYWYRKPELLLELIRLPAGPAAVAMASSMWYDIFEGEMMAPELTDEAAALLLAAPDFTDELLSYMRIAGCHGETAMYVVIGVLNLQVPALTQALLAIPQLGEALARCCSETEPFWNMYALLAHALSCEDLQQYLAQQPLLQRALTMALWGDEDGEMVSEFWQILAWEDRGDGWLLQQPVLLDGLVWSMVMSETTWPMYLAAKRLLRLQPSSVCASVLRQPGVMQDLMRELPQTHLEPPPDDTVLAPGTMQVLLVQHLATSELAPQALGVMLRLLAEGDAGLSDGVFDVMHFMQKHALSVGLPAAGCWWRELAASSSRGAPVQLADQQLAALRLGALEVRTAAAAAAAVTQEVQEQQRAAVAAVGIQAAVGEQGTGRSRQAPRRRANPDGPAAQQQAQQGVGVVAGSSSRRRGTLTGAADESHAAAAGGRRRTGPPAAAAAAVSGGGGGEGAGAPAAAKRTRR